MNTLTSFALSDAASRQSFRTSFKAFAKARTLTPELMAYHAIALGRPLSRAFSPITNANKLANGQSAWQGAIGALYGLVRSDAVTSLALLNGHHLESLRDAARNVSAEQLAQSYNAH